MINRIKTGGRTKGTPNKTTNEIRLKFETLINDNLENLENDIKALEPKERIKTIIELSKFVIPTYKAIDLNIEDEDKEPTQYNITFHTIDTSKPLSEQI